MISRRFPRSVIMTDVFVQKRSILVKTLLLQTLQVQRYGTFFSVLDDIPNWMFALVLLLAKNTGLEGNAMLLVVYSPSMYVQHLDELCGIHGVEAMVILANTVRTRGCH